LPTHSLTHYSRAHAGLETAKRIAAFGTFSLSPLSYIIFLSSSHTSSSACVLLFPSFLIQDACAGPPTLKKREYFGTSETFYISKEVQSKRISSPVFWLCNFFLFCSSFCSPRPQFSPEESFPPSLCRRGLSDEQRLQHLQGPLLQTAKESQEPAQEGEGDEGQFV